MAEYFTGLAKKYAPRTVNLRMDAVRFFCTYINRPELMDGIRHMRTNKPLPRIHSKEEALLLIDETRNPKHRLLLSLCYGCGLRVSELVPLRVADLNWDRLVLTVRDNAKGKKHRECPLWDEVRPLFNEVTHGMGQLGYVFSGQKTGHLSARSAEKVYTQACNRIGIVPTGIHTLRHSFITHLIEAGNNTAVVALLAGHSSVRTTEQYLHISRRHREGIQSPMAGAKRAVLYELNVG
jgi:integrase